MLWIEVLNRALEWNTPGTARQWLHPQGGAPLEADVLVALQRDVQLLHRVFASRAGGSALDAEDAVQLARWLATVTLQPAVRALATLPAGSEGLAWPGCVARRHSGGTCEPFESLLTTALVQLLGLPADWLGSVVHRCEGRRPGPAPDAARMGEMGRGAAAARDGRVDAARAHQCPRLVWSARGRRFCSKACSNASFAARKVQREPRYFAAKQERYRARRKRQQRPRARAGAFVYMD